MGASLCIVWGLAVCLMDYMAYRASVRLGAAIAARVSAASLALAILAVVVLVLRGCRP